MRRYVLLALGLAGFWVASGWTAPDREGERLKNMHTMGMGHLRSWLDEHGMDMGQLAMMSMWTDSSSMTHMKMQEMYRGLPVFGGEMILHMNPDGSQFAMTDSMVPGFRVEGEPRLGRRQAIDEALRAYGCGDCFTGKPQVRLVGMRHGEEDHIVYEVRLSRLDGSADTAMPVYYVDASDGAMVLSYDNLQTATGSSLYSGPVSFNSLFRSPTYYLEDVTRRLGTFDMRNGTTSVYRFTDTDDVWDATNQRAAVDAHYAAGKVYDYYLSVHGRNGIDGAGGPAYYTSADGVTGLVSSRVHYSTRYNNAFWNGQTMTYGDGDGVTFTPLVTLDIAGHEMTHGVTERTAGLVYSGESGALNESMSDVFGALVERHAQGESSESWKIGEQAYTPGTAGDALRYMDNPHLASNSGFTADDDPDHYSERYTGTSDNGGVHINSGIANKAFYLLAKGGSHHLGGSMTGIGADGAAAIWYSALTSYMTSSTNFAAARTATLNAAAARYGAASAEYTATASAWCLVGVGTCSGPTPPPGGGGSELFGNGGFEGSASPTVLSGANAYYVSPGNYPHAGTGYIYFGTTNNATGQGYQQISIPSTATAANLTFWLNVTSAETTTTTQYDRLFVEVRNSAGTLLGTLATYSNLSKGTAGAYAQKGAFSLLAYKGQTIRVQFRATTDSSLATTFRVDDVSVK
jgi:Zn-dependent metalloprotease